MNWEKIDIKTIMNMLKEMEKQSVSLFGEFAVVYSDGKEELKISYKNLEK